MFSASQPKFLADNSRFCCNANDVEQSPYQRLGGNEGIRPIIDDFIERVTSDVMIGFFFRAVDKDRLKALETQFAVAHLGGPPAYEGRPLPQAHAHHRIMGGQFNRRLRLLEQTLNDHAVAADITAAWLAHNESMRAHITANTANECRSPDEPPSAGHVSLLSQKKP